MSQSAIHLTLYVSGDTARTRQAVQAARGVQGLTGDRPVHLSVVDVGQQPAVAEERNIQCIPTLVLEGAQPPRRIVGDLGSPGDVLVRLGVPETTLALADVEALRGMAAILAAAGWPNDAALRFDAFLDRVAATTGHRRRRTPLRSYCIGLAHPGGPKTTARLAAHGDPATESRRYQSMHHLVSQADWSDAAVLEVAADHARSTVLESGPVVWVIGERAAPRSSKRTVGVARQHFGPRSAVGPCQLALVVALAGPRRSLLLDHQLHLPKAWAESAGLRAQADVPKSVKVQPRWSLALDLVDQVLDRGGPKPDLVRVDAVYAGHSEFLRGLNKRNLEVVVSGPGETPAGLGVLDEMRARVGLDDYTGRGWRGFHHHATLCAATYGFMLAEDAGRVQ